MNRLFLLPLLSLASLSACQGIAPESQPPRTAEPVGLYAPRQPPESRLAEDLMGSWRLVSFAGKSVRADQLAVTFTPTSFIANVNCNRVNGRYALRGNSLIPEQAYATEKGCGPAYEFDEALTRSLQFGMVVSMPDRTTLVGQVGERRTSVREDTAARFAPHSVPSRLSLQQLVGTARRLSIRELPIILGMRPCTSKSATGPARFRCYSA